MEMPRTEDNLSGEGDEDQGDGVAETRLAHTEGRGRPGRAQPEALPADHHLV